MDMKPHQSPHSPKQWDQLAAHYRRRHRWLRQALDTFDEMRTALNQRAFPLDGTAAPYLTAWFSNQDPRDTP
jgi:hypothetical protein